ncbi:phage regulatory CII family protein [Maridesulfovibrio ferrireducens]|uniref:phage regulatory CII family protein n=1 Tax=Maridesulfovibrio ferrireducens TaxID=246191 RepID=UPI001A34C80D|nr:phage regulatory CII family protein [Maridesulfovibrio ferrireducens]MBI9112226.1 hypothetical protein [Maridesulfovibrio ferrireducens]
MTKTLTELLHEIVQKSGCSREVAEAVEKKYHVLLNELNPDSDSHKLGVNMLIPIMRICRTVEPLHFLAKKFGGVFIKLPESDSCERDVIKVVKEFGEFIAAYGEGIKDGSLSCSDKVKIRKEGHEALTAIQELLCSLK